MSWLRALLVLTVACGQPAGAGERERARPPVFREIELATAAGLSGLARDNDGALWSVSERAGLIYRIVLDRKLRPTIQAFPIEQLAEKIDLEGIAVIGDGKFALGTEGRIDGAANVLLAERRGAAIIITGVIALSEQVLGLKLPMNAGAEGMCGVGDKLLVGIEATGEDAGRRWAPLAVIEDGKVARVHRLWLMTATGKLSALDCRRARDGTIEVLAIERHFEHTKILRFTLPAGPGDITPIEALDLGPILKSRLNLEGIAWTEDGNVVAVTDNQWKKISGPSLLLVFAPGAVR
ncbi:MAG: esterase-like activity of phytase family protein [Deltaproteobacteria bacterium]|nr:esterase-like activity of phytase family protein [Deltaproteobacteria bacterium]MDQ3297476.1 esterase-like activity of phytase family protein [Myxococcota bacterium]